MINNNTNKMNTLRKRIKTNNSLIKKRFNLLWSKIHLICYDHWKVLNKSLKLIKESDLTINNFVKRFEK